MVFSQYITVAESLRRVSIAESINRFFYQLEAYYCIENPSLATPYSGIGRIQSRIRGCNYFYNVPEVFFNPSPVHPWQMRGEYHDCDGC